MTSRPAVVAAVLLSFAAAAAGAVWWWSRSVVVPVAPSASERDARREATGEARRDAATIERVQAVEVAEPADDAFAQCRDDLARAIAAGAAAEAAARMRRLLRTDQGAFAEACEALLAEDTDGDMRQALAMVLGTLAVDGVDDVLLAALDQHREDQGTVVALIAALGALRDPPDDDDVFDMEAAPHFAAHGPGGMGITVRNILSDPRVEQALGALLLDRERREVRLAAARAMQFSVGQEFTRTRFCTALEGELDDRTAALLAQSLGTWSRRRDDVDSRRIVDQIVQAADRPGFDEYRLRLETALLDCSFDESTLSQLATWTMPESSYEMRTFAFRALLAQRPVAPATRESLVGIAAGDPDRAMRDFAAKALGNLTASLDSVAALRQLYAQTDDWSLRVTALSSLARILPPAERQALLQQAMADDDERVRRRAQRLGG